MKWFLLSLLLLLVAVYIFINTPFGQNFIARQVTKRFSKELQTKISINHISFSLLNKMHLEGLLIEDKQGDTLLYAGDMKVKITDWFIFKKEAELKYIGLEDAIIKFQRTDSIWSQQFLFDYFSSPSTGTSKKKAGLKLNLKKIEFKNVSFLKKDAWLGEDLSIVLSQLHLDADKLSLSGNQYDINSLLLHNPVVSIRNYTRRKPKRSNPVSFQENEAPSNTASWNTGQTKLRVGNLKIINGTFKTDKGDSRQPFAHFDGQHILFTEINGDFSNPSFIGDTVLTKLKLSAKERSGFEVKNMTADVKMTPQGMFFSNLDLSTNKSTIRNYFSMSYNDMSDLGYFISRVKMAANFDGSYIDSDDIAFFAPAMQTWKKEITLKGKVRGTVDDLIGRDMLVQAGNNTLLKGDITLTGLPDINKTFIDFTANEFRTTYSDAIAIIPSLKKIRTPDLSKIQYVNFKGSFTGFIRDFVTFGTIQTNLGVIRSDINMKLPLRQDPVYSGNIATDHFRLGDFLNNKDIGTVSFAGTVKGKGFNEKSRNTLIDGSIHFAEYNNYRYSNVSVKGRLFKKLFEGFASMRDEHANLDLNGIIDFNSKSPRFNLIADVTKINFKNLNLTKDSLGFKGKLNFNFTSANIDNFLGAARITDAELTKDGKRLPFDSLIISADYIDSVKQLTAVSNEFKASIKGNYHLQELPDAFTFLLNKYYPAYITAPRRFPVNQDFEFDITTYNIDEYFQLIDTSFTGFNNSYLAGKLNLANNTLDVTADIPQFKFKQFNFDDVKLIAKGSADSLVLLGRTRNIRINDSLNIPLALFKVNAHNDSSRVTIISGANQTVEKANLNALLLTYNDGVKIEFDPSSFTVNGKLWTIDESGELIFRSNTPTSGQLVLSEGEQKILLKTHPSDIGNWNDLTVELTKINLNDFAPFFMPKNRLEGLLSGSISVEDPTGNIKIYSDDIQTQFLRLDNDSLGELKATLAYDNISKELKIKGNTINQENYLGYDATIFLGDKAKAKNNLIALRAKQFSIRILERFLGNLFSDMQGFLTGDINISGEFQNLNVTGKGRLKDAGLRVNFTQCFYKILDTDIALTQNEINMDGIILTDTVTGNPVYLRGGIEHESFRNMFYNLDISTQKPNTIGEAFNKPVQLLQTTYLDNKQFYGNVKGTGSLSLLGPQSDMYMKIDASASTKDSSSVTLPSSSGRESGIADFLVERKYGREMNDSDFTKNATKIVYDVDITANPMVTVKVILDELTGDEIKGKGSGSLNIRSGTAEPLALRGRFDIEEGNYLFTFQSFFKKPFELRKDAENFIEWNGDPYNANIKFEALYKAERVSFTPLAKLKQITSGASNARGDVFVVAKLTDKLFKPTIEFALDFPNTSVAVTDPELALIVQQLQKNTTEITKQATYLIVFNSFAPSDNSLLGSNVSGQGLVLNTVSGIFLNVISEELNKILGGLFKNDKYNISLNTSIYNRNMIDQNSGTTLNLGSNVSFSIGRSFFNNRFIISTGVGLDAPLQQQTNIQQSIQLLPDVTLEWLINQSGSIRAAFFYRENTDYLSTNSSGLGRARRYGGSLNFRRDFDKINEIFRKKKKAAIVPSSTDTKIDEKTSTPPEIKKDFPLP